MIGRTGVVGIWRVGALVRISCTPGVLVSFSAVVLVWWIDVVLVQWTDAILVLEIDTVPPRTALVECNTKLM